MVAVELLVVLGLFAVVLVGGADGGAGLRGTVAPWLLGLQARATARMGDEENALQAIAQAVELRERVVPGDLDELGGLLTYSHAKQLYYTVEAEALLGHSNEALTRQAEEAVLKFSDEEAPDWVFTDRFRMRFEGVSSR
ncbi:hypothetical protein ACFUIZ_33845 [Streptomyces cinereoruber]|uniref:hypothetical protein n=1 Tax=Streptomyces cinereoruber TaxID=67260 RepID=UPI00362FD1CC